MMTGIQKAKRKTWRFVVRDKWFVLLVCYVWFHGDFAEHCTGKQPNTTFLTRVPQRDLSNAKEEWSKFTWTRDRSVSIERLSPLRAREPDGNHGATGQKFILPVFPLRKEVKLPSETLTLNLYEERYLKLAEHILQGDQCTRSNQTIFGALYCSDKPQIIRRGSGPIVPMIESGDIGVICCVIHSEEGMVPARSSEKLRRRVKLQGLAIDRFVVDQVLHDGYGGGDTAETTSNKTFPYILAAVSILNDISPIPGSAEEKKVIELELKHFDKYFRRVRDLDRPTVKSTQSDCSDVGNCSCIFPLELKDEVSGRIQEKTHRHCEAGLSPSQRALLQWVDDEGKRRQFCSFVSAANLPLEIATKDMLRLLKLVSTEERLKFIDEIVLRSSLLSRAQSLGDSFKR